MDEPWKHNQYINLVKFDEYHGEAPKIDGVYCSIQKDPDTAYNEFKAGTIDFAQIPTGQIKDNVDKYGKSEDGYTSTPGKQCLLGVELSTYFMIPCSQDPVLADVNVRRALSLAINRQNIVDTLYEVPAYPPPPSCRPPLTTRRRMSGSTASTIPIRPSRFSRTLATPQTPMASAVLRLR